MQPKKLTPKINDTSIKDVLFIIVIGLASLFVIAFLLINPPTKKHDAPKKAEYLFTLEWHKDSTDDLDIWVLGPQGNVLSFRDKSVGLLHLERDDLGMSNDKYKEDDGTVHYVRFNREVVTMRGLQPGKYTIAVGVYQNTFTLLESIQKGGKSERVNYSPNDQKLLDTKQFTVNIIKMNPSYKEVYSVTLPYRLKGQELTIANFEINDNGDIVSLDTYDNPFIYRNTKGGGVERASEN